MPPEPGLSAELDAAEATVTEWGSLDSSGRLFAYGHDEFTARSVVASRERYGLHDVLVCRTVTYGPWEPAENVSAPAAAMGEDERP